jgi:hypothetical protein
MKRSLRVLKRWALILTIVVNAIQLIKLLLAN